MEELTEQIEQAIQIYFDRSGIKENVKIEIFKRQSMLWEIIVYTEHLLTMDIMHDINGLVYLSVPFGVMHEVLNVLDGDKVETKITPEGHEYQTNYVAVSNTPSKKKR